MVLVDKDKILDDIADYFQKDIFEGHINNIVKKHSKLKSYMINPILIKYLSKTLENDFNSIGFAKALYYPRVLGTSINTSFGTKLQTMFIKLHLADGSLIQGMDIEFKDKVDGRKKWCQIKSGPNTINSGDVKPLLDKFNSVTNLARTNGIAMNNSDLILGILYGDESQLSQHYKLIDNYYPVIIGREFWYRLTGYPDFYDRLVIKLDEVIKNLDTQDDFVAGYMALAKEIDESDLL